MVLKVKETDIPAFEGDETTVATQESPAPEAAVETKVEAPAAIAKITSGAVVVKPPKALKATAAFADYESALPDVEFGTFPRITTDLGGFEMDKEVIGATIKVELMSWTHRYVVSPGAKDKEANELVRYSNDGINMSDGTGTVAAYLQALKEIHGYDKAAVKTYIDLTGMLLAKKGVEIPEDDQVIVQVQLSPQSVKQYNGFRITKGVMEARKGVQTGNILTMAVARGEFSCNKFAYVTFK